MDGFLYEYFVRTNKGLKIKRATRDWSIRYDTPDLEIHPLNNDVIMRDTDSLNL